MAICKKIRRVDKKVCIGAMNRKIILLDRSIVPPVNGSVDFDEAFSGGKTVWANIVSKRGAVFFDSSNTANSNSHDIYIRYFPGLTAEKWVFLPAVDSSVNAYLDILSVINLNEERKFYLLECTIRGDAAKPVNYAGI